MESLSLGDIARITTGTVRQQHQAIEVSGLCIDSRDVQPGDLFVCLPGSRCHGNDYAAEALSAGARAVLTCEQGDDEPRIVVADAAVALWSLGVDFRSRLSKNAHVIAITGSNGKTSTKDLTAAALGSTFDVVSSKRSFNNTLGVPLTLAETTGGTNCVVAELGSNGTGEIAHLAKLVHPHVGVITNVQQAHLEGLSSLQGVREEKGSLLTLLKGKKISILNRDDPSFDQLSAMAAGKVLSFGLSEAADVRGVNLHCELGQTSFCLAREGLEVTTQHTGQHGVLNALAALAVAQSVGVDLPCAIEALAAVPPPPGRLESHRFNGLTVIDDSYNANPGSVRAASEALAEITLDGRLLVVVGEMLELGDAGETLHREMGESLAKCGASRLLAVGQYGAALQEGAIQGGMARAATTVCSSLEEAKDVLLSEIQDGDTVYLKGSRAVGMENLLPALKGLQVTAA
ncbi:MAG: UDP-N-acetylmuramoyl-tripeptide--D-alanyl-D-alanine ligase [Planctomycetota bacterium]|nr:UDP-N-acetylmuramoyl-tripeptide--D-alanyl-D-alanine ligase [Planctomycetota bacterium]